MTKVPNSIRILPVLGLFLKEGELMNYEELAKQFLHNSHQFRIRGHQKKIDEIMQGEVFAMSYILRHGSMVLPSEISNEMNISSARVAAILNNLENKGFVTRQINKNDRRQILVGITEKGTEFVEMHNKMVVNSTARMLEMLGEYDAKELVRIMEKLSQYAPNVTNNK